MEEERQIFQPPEPSLNDIIYPSRSTPPSCFVLPNIGENVNFELKYHTIQILQKFTGVEHAYVFLREFDEACELNKYNGVTEDALRLRAIPFALIGNAKKWMYSLLPNSIKTWNDFVEVFLKKYFPHARTNKLRNRTNKT